MRLTAAPLHLLVAVARGAELRECECRPHHWFVLTRPGRDPERVHARAFNTLSWLGLIERTGDIWRVGASGSAWLAENGIVANSEKQTKSLVASPGK